MLAKVVSVFLGLLFAANLSAAELTVHAAASLTDALKQIGVVYEKESRDTVLFNFGASNALVRQIEEGAPGDVFLSADQAKMDELETKGLLLPGTRHNLLSNQLVIIVPAGAKLAPRSPEDLRQAEYKRIALAEPATVPAGIYAREYLTKKGVWDAVKAKVVPLESVRAALAAVESGNVEAGIVYKTDAAISNKVSVALEISREDGPAITYPLAVLKSAKDPQKAKAFAEYLFAPAAEGFFRKLGFILAR